MRESVRWPSLRFSFQAPTAGRTCALLVQPLDPVDRDVEIAHRAEFAVQPFQFIPDLVADRVFDHRREKNRMAVRRCVSAIRI